MKAIVFCLAWKCVLQLCGLSIACLQIVEFEAWIHEVCRKCYRDIYCSLGCKIHVVVIRITFTVWICFFVNVICVLLL